MCQNSDVNPACRISRAKSIGPVRPTCAVVQLLYRPNQQYDKDQDDGQLSCYDDDDMTVTMTMTMITIIIIVILIGVFIVIIILIRPIYYK